MSDRGSVDWVALSPDPEADRSLYLAAVRDSTEMMESASADRLVAVRLAYRLGVPVPVIAEAAGVSRGRVYQIISNTNGDQA